MYRSTSRLGVLLTLASLPLLADSQEQGYAGIGRAALPQEIAAWDIDVRPDFNGLPRGSGSVTRGQEIWDAQCAGCHGFFGESTEFYRPIVGGTTAEDSQTGRTAILASNAPLLTTLSVLSTLSTLWDYIHRAMPWTAPKSLSDDDVYAVVGYILHLGNLVPADFVLSEANIADVQALLPNRDGMVAYEGLWNVHGQPDVSNVACMKNCAVNASIVSEFPRRALEASGNPAEQNRSWGPIRGVDLAPGTQTDEGSKGGAHIAAAGIDGEEVAKRSGCLICHGVDRRVLGPSLIEIAGKYGRGNDAMEHLMHAVRSGSKGVWGAAAMPPQQIEEDELRAVIQWIQAQGTPE